MMNEDQDNEVINIDVYKGYTCTTRNPFGFWDIKSDNGGAVNSKLQGQFTTLVNCHQAIDAYLLHKEATAPKSAAEKSKEKVLAKLAKEQELRSDEQTV